MKTIGTELLEIAYEEGGPEDGPLVLLLHRWPDAPRGWSAIAQRLHSKGLAYLGAVSSGHRSNEIPT